MIPGYTLHSNVYEGHTVSVWRGLRDSDDLPIVIKIVQGKPPLLQGIHRLKQEYDIARSLPVSGIVHPLDLLEFDGGCALVLEETAGISLRHAIAKTPFSIESALAISARLAGALGEIHSHNVVHKDIKPGNIIIGEKDLSVRITDFGLASVVLKNAQDTASVLRPEGTLAYISPEQTGRMNCRVDWRSDLYSLGVSLFELFTGKLPFSEEDSLALVHAHIARIPPSASDIHPQLPPVVGAIISRLMAKSPDERYQSAMGLQKDLLHCLDCYLSTGKIPDFPLGQHDISDKFHIPHKLYGREREIEMLLSAFNSATNGQAKMVTISGYSGIGKSALVHKLQRPIIKQSGYFITGKFDQFNLNIPYSSLIQAFHELIRQALTENGEHISLLKNKLLRALGENAQVIIDIIPELAAIIGKQPAAPELPASESQNRFTTLFLKLTQAFASEERPLCLFLDDLQWADLPSLKLIADIMVDFETRHILLLGAYRDNEVDSAHPLVKTLAKIVGMGVEAEQIVLAPLNEADICKMIEGTFNCPIDDAGSLAGICIGKTGGNPFFLSQFLRKLYEDEAVKFDFHAAEWRCDFDKIREIETTDNVVTLMSEKIRDLSERGKSALKYAACIGNTFSLSTLAVVSGKQGRETLDDLDDGIKEGLILPLESGVLQAPPLSLDEAEEENRNFRFLHDRVQQAAYSLFGEDEKREAHLKVGRLMLENIVSADRGGQIFDIVSHLNKGASLIADSLERKKLALLNLAAGKKAKSSGAFEPAYRYFEAISACLPDNPWESAYSLTLEYHLERGEAAYLCGNYEECYALCNAAFSHVRELLDRVRVYEVLILACRSEGKNREAVNCALGILQELGERYPETPGEHHLIIPVMKTKWLLRGKSDAELLSLPLLEDPYKQAILRVMTKAGASTYITDPLLTALWIFAQIEITVNYGRSSITPFAYSAYGLFLCGALKEYDEGSRFARLAQQFAGQSPSAEVKGKTLLNIALFIQHWRFNKAEVEHTIWEAHEHALTEGDLESAAITLYVASQSLPWYYGENLATYGRKMEKFLPSLKKLGQERVNQWAQIFHQTVCNLTNPEIENPTAIVGEFADTEKILANIDAQGDMAGKGLIFVNRLILCCIFHEFEHAAAYVESADKLVQSLSGQLSERQYHLYSNLALLALSAAMNGADKSKTLKRAKKSLLALRRMETDSCPASRHAPFLLEAEIMRVETQNERAADLYDHAIQNAKACRHHYEEALAYELCGRFYLARDKALIAEGYLNRAFVAYRNWGAMAKLVRMPKLYPGITFPRIDTAQVGPEQNAALNMHPTPHASSSGVDRYLDLETVLKATRAISGEIFLPRLLEELLKIVLENAGAQRGILLLDEEGELLIEGEIGRGETVVLQSASLHGYQSIPHSIINYVRRAQSGIVLNDAQHEGEFSQDPYISSGIIRSLLCMPILNKGDFMGVLYLENNSAPGAFTMERLEILKVITAQIAISIENARLYESIERKVDERTRELQEKTELLNQTNKEMSHEIEQRKILEEELRKLATVDSLTGLLLRRRLFELGEAEINRAKRSGLQLSLLVLDIDHFKSINDTFGHAIGDEVLKCFSDIFRDSLRNVDIVCRFGGEEFVAILPDTSTQVAMAVAQRLRINVETNTLFIDSVEVKYTISAGVAGLQEQDTEINHLIKRADEALYQAKKSGRNKVVLAPHSSSAAAEA